jgi:hypothetical protein
VDWYGTSFLRLSLHFRTLATDRPAFMAWTVIIFAENCPVLKIYVRSIFGVLNLNIVGFCPGPDRKVGTGPTLQQILFLAFSVSTITVALWSKLRNAFAHCNRGFESHSITDVYLRSVFVSALATRPRADPSPRESYQLFLRYNKQTNKKLRGLSPRANCTDRAASVCRRS